MMASPEVGAELPSTPASPTSAQASLGDAEAQEWLVLRWEEKAILHVLQVTLIGKDTQSVLLPAAAKEIPKGAGGVARLKDALDSVLVERLNLPLKSYSSHLGYLISCYRRAKAHSCAMKAEQRVMIKQGGKKLYFPSTPEQEQLCHASINQILTTLVHYCTLVLGEAADDVIEVVGVRTKSMSELRRLFYANPTMSRTFPDEFLAKLCHSLTEQEDLDNVLLPLLQEVYANSRNLEIDTAARYLRLLIKFAAEPALAHMLVKHPSFLGTAGLDAPRFERETFLGPFFSISSLQATAFGNLRQRTMRDVDECVKTERNSQAAYRNLLHQLFKLLVKDAAARNQTAQWICRALNGNMERRKMQYDRARVASDSFVLNLSCVMLRLSMPMVRSKKPKFDKVDMHYLIPPAPSPPSSTPRINLEGVTRFGLTAGDLKAQTDARTAQLQGAQESFGFGTQCFFCTHEALHIGLVRSFKQFPQLMRQIQQRQTGLARLDQSNPMHAAVHRQESMMLDKMLSDSLRLRCILLDEEMIAELLTFNNWTCEWMSRMHQGPQLPLVPEYIVEDLTELFAFLHRTGKGKLVREFAGTKRKVQGLLDFILKFMGGRAALKNPHLRGKFSEVLLLFLPDQDQPSSFGVGGADDAHVFVANPRCREELLPALLEVYVNVEFGEGQFEEKYFSRDCIHTILEFLWDVPCYHQQLMALCGQPSIEGFINMLANDVLYLLDESLSHLKEVRGVQQEMLDSATWQQQPRQRQQQREGQHQHEEMLATVYTQRANGTVKILHKMTKLTPEPFLEPEFVQRYAHIVGYFVDTLVGPRIKDLKVSNKEKYHFEPRTLLARIAGIFLHLSHDHGFLSAVAHDERSYKPELFNKLLKMVSKKKILGAADVAKMEKALTEVERLREEEEEEQEILGEIPDEFQDPLMCSLMVDPVILPVSGEIIDRATIKRHLLNNPNNPFTRQPMTYEEVRPAVELKARIASWIAEQKAKHPPR